MIFDNVLWLFRFCNHLFFVELGTTKTLLPYFLSSVLGNNITVDILIGYIAEKTEHVELYFISCMGNLTKAQLQILKIFQNGKMKKLKCTYFWCNTLASWYSNRRHILFVFFQIVFHSLHRQNNQYIFFTLIWTYQWHRYNMKNSIYLYGTCLRYNMIYIWI